MGEVKHFKKAEMRFEAYGGPPGKAEICRLVGPDLSKTMGAGIAIFDGCTIDWTVLYDEMIVVLEGNFRLKHPGGIIEAGPGDVLWLPEKTPITYMGDKAKVCYSLFPVDWRKKHNL